MYNRKYMIIVSFMVITLLLASIGFTYSFFVVGVYGNNDASSIIVNAADLRLVFNDTQYINASKISPGWEEVKTFSVTNESSVGVNYNLVWESVNNTFVNRDTLTYSVTSSDEVCTINEGVVPSTGSNISICNNILIGAGEVHTYTFKVHYINASFDQSSDMRSSLEGKLTITNNITYSYDLPSDYVKVEYLESHGSEYIDTGYYLRTNNEKVEIDFVKTDVSTFTSLFGSEYTPDGNIGHRIFSIIPHGQSGIQIFVGTGGNVSFNTQVNERYVLSANIDNNVLSVNVVNKETGNIQNLSGGVDFSNGNLEDNLSSIVLFANNTTGSVSQRASAKIYSFKLWDNDVLVRYLIPCYSKEDDTFGMYDVVGKTFYSNEGAGAFNAGEFILENNYTSIEYLGTNGQEYIDSGVGASGELKVETLQAYSSVSGGAEYTNSGYFFKGVSSEQWYSGIGSHYSGTGLSADLDWHTHVLEQKNDMSGGYYLDGVKIYNQQSISNNQNSIYLFGIRNFGSYNRMKAKYYKIWQNGQLVRYFVCAKRDSDGTVGLYDLLSGDFYTNDGEGQFYTKSDFVEVEYIESHGQEYIDSGVLPNGELKIETLQAYNNLSNGAEYTNSSYFLKGILDGYWYVGIGSDYRKTSQVADTSWHTHIMEQKTDLTGGYYIDGNKVYNQVSTINSNASIYLFGIREFSAYNSIKCKYVKIWKNGQLVRDYVPTISSRTGQVGLYDLVNDTFYPNLGSNNFSYQR